MMHKPAPATDPTDDFGQRTQKTGAGGRLDRFESAPADAEGCVQVRCAFIGKLDLLRFGPANSRRVWHRVGDDWRELSEAAVQRLVNQLTEAARNSTWDATESGGPETYHQLLRLVAATYGKQLAELDIGFSSLKK